MHLNLSSPKKEGSYGGRLPSAVHMAPAHLHAPQDSNKMHHEQNSTPVAG